MGMGSLEHHKGFGTLQPQFWEARTATDCKHYCCCRLINYYL